MSLDPVKMKKAVGWRAAAPTIEPRGRGASGGRRIVAEVGGSSIGIVRCVLGDLCKEPADAIVNAANVFLANGAGVAKFIKLAGGFAPSSAGQEGRGGWSGRGRGGGRNEGQGFLIQLECDAFIRQNGPLVAGETVAVTSGGAMPAKFVIHTVGPCWRGVNVDNGETEVIGTITALRGGGGGSFRTDAGLSHPFGGHACGNGYNAPAVGDVVRAVLRPSPPKAPPNFACRYVAPLGGESAQTDEQLLAGAVRVALLAAAAQGCVSISLPAISSGLFGFPRPLACDVIVGECFAFLHEAADCVESSLKQINLTNIDEETTLDMQCALERFQQVSLQS
jgi:O-acetyl-ADP-ribose deacetylase (regulator of RNase III)